MNNGGTFDVDTVCAKGVRLLFTETETNDNNNRSVELEVSAVEKWGL
jgi:hypothetical protein